MTTPMPDLTKPPKVRIVIDTENQTIPPDWREFQGVWFLLAPMDNSAARCIRQQVADLGLDPLAAAEKQDTLFADAIIKDWHGPTRPDKSKLPVNDITKYILINKVPGLKNWVMPESERVAEAHLFQIEEQLGNSGSGAAGSPGAPGAPTAE